MGPSAGEILAILFTICVPALLIFYFAKRWFGLKEKQLEVNSRHAAERAAEYAVSNKDLEQRVRVLEQIVTDTGAHTAAQIEALRAPRLSAVAEAH